MQTESGLPQVIYKSMISKDLQKDIFYTPSFKDSI